MKNQKELDNLIDKIRLQVIEHTGLDVTKRYQYRDNSGRASNGLIEARFMFLKVLESYYSIVENENTLFFAKLLRMKRSNLCILLGNIKNGHKTPREEDNTNFIIKNQVEGQIFLRLKTKTLKSKLIEFRNVY